MSSLTAKPYSRLARHARPAPFTAMNLPTHSTRRGRGQAASAGPAAAMEQTSILARPDTRAATTTHAHATPTARPTSAPASHHHQAPSSPMLLMSIASSLALAGLVAAAISAEPACAADAATTSTNAVEQFQLAEGGQEFFSNVARYGRYFVTVMLGTGYVMLRPLTAAFKNPVSGILALLGVAGSVYFVKFTLEAMLGMSSDTGLGFEYVQGNF